MSETATTLMDHLLKLSEADRVLIAEGLWASLSEEAQQEMRDATPDDPAFEAEIARRSDSLHDGTAELVSWEDARRQIAAELERRRAARAQEPS